MDQGENAEPSHIQPTIDPIDWFKTRKGKDAGAEKL